jgi:hypothetical protein
MRADIPGKGPIEFEGRVLPEGAKYFEVAPFYKALSPEVKRWILDLRYAWARERSAPSHLILRACDEIETRIYAERDSTFAHLKKIFPEFDPAEMCAEWLSALMTMRECAERCGVCVWTMHPQTGEVAYFLSVTIRIFKTMVTTQNAQRHQHEKIPNPAVLAIIESRSEEEQIAFINSVMDGLSDPPSAEPGAGDDSPKAGCGSV